jgi:protein phosphatase
MGTTIVAALVEERGVAVAHVGDSRLYLLERGGRLRQLTGDDCWVPGLLVDHSAAAGRHREGERPKEQSLQTVGAWGGIATHNARHHPLRHVLTNVVGNRLGAHVHVAQEPLAPGDRLLLTTDGVHGVLEDACLERLLKGRDLQAVASSLVRAALAQGSRDNCTALVAEYMA